MAASKTYFSTQNYHFLTSEMLTTSTGSDSLFELDESDIWNISSSPQSRKPLPSSRISKRSSSTNLKRREIGVTASSLPVNVPDWSKILKQDHTENRKRDSDDDGFDDDNCDDRIPPHEFLARTRMASFSVHEGIGRTLKGRDLSRVRNTIFEITGFQD